MKTSGLLNPDKNDMNKAMKTPFILLAFALALLGTGCRHKTDAPFSGANVLVRFSNVLNISSKINPAEAPAPVPESGPDAADPASTPDRTHLTPNPPLTTTHN